MIATIDAPVEHAHLLQERGHLAFRMGDQAAAAEWATQALQCLQTLPIDGTTEAGREAARAMAEALNTKGVALARLGRRRDAVQEVERSLSVAEKADLQSAACRAIPISAYSTRSSIRPTPSRSAAVGWRSQPVSAISASRRAFSPISQYPAVPSPIAVRPKACRRRKRRSKSTGGSISAITCRCR